MVALTEACQETLTSCGVPESKIVVLGSSVDLEPYERLSSRSELRRQHDLPLERPIVGYIGRFQTMGSEKGLSTLVAAIGELHRKHGLTPLLVCVGGPMAHVPAYIEAGCAAGARAEDLRFIDHVPSAEVPSWIGACDIGVIPFPQTARLASFASPLKTFEFMAAGLPIVASDLPALREALGHDRNAWLVTPESPEDLAEGLARVLTDPQLRERLGAQNRRDVTRHTWKSRAATILARLGSDYSSDASSP